MLSWIDSIRSTLAINFMPTRSLSGMRTILTGATAGIGRAIALQLVAAGGRVIVTGRREDRLRELIAEAKSPDMHYVAGEITEAPLREKLLSTCLDRFGGLDCLINNAGMTGIGKFADNDEERLRRIMEVNFFSPLALTRLCIPELRKGTHPIIVNVASVLGHVAVPKKTEYIASKFALHGFSDSLRAELRPEGIDVMLLSPSTTDTEIFDVGYGDRKQIPWANAKGQSPEAVARAALRGIRRGSQEIILTIGGKGLVWFDRLFPNTANYLIGKFA